MVLFVNNFIVWNLNDITSTNYLTLLFYFNLYKIIHKGIIKDLKDKNHFFF